MYSCSQISLIFIGHRSKICGPHFDVIWAAGTTLPKRKSSKDFILQFRKYSNHLLVPLFKCSFSWFYLSWNAVFRGFTYLQTQFLVVLSAFKCSFSWFYLSSNAVFRGFIFLQTQFLMGFISLQMQFFVLLSVFERSFSWFYLSSNAVFRGFICLQTQFFVLISLYKFSYSCLYVFKCGF